LSVNVPADFRAWLVRVDDDPVGFHDGGWWLRILSNRMLGTGATSQKTGHKEAGDENDRK
jgi:hypothetical protein